MGDTCERLYIKCLLDHLRKSISIVNQSPTLFNEINKMEKKEIGTMVFTQYKDRFQLFIGLALLFRSIDAFKTFDIIYVLTSGGPGILTRTLNLYAFKHGIEYLSMGYAGSIAIVMLIITIVVAQIFLRKNKLLLPKDTLKR